MKKLALFLITPLLLVAVMTKHVSASTQDFVIHNFDADYTLTNQDKQGSLHIVEKINLTFTDFNHGIYRYIPSSYKNNS